MRELHIFACGVVFGVVLWLMFATLGSAPLQQYDEGTYAKIVGESLEHHDFLTFTYDGNLFFEKPPLYFWLAGIATAVTGNPTLGIRLPAVVAGVVLVAATMLLLYAATRTPWAAAMAGILLVATPPFVEAARHARFDVLVALGLIVALWALVVRKELIFWLALAFAVMSKSVIGLFALIPAVFFLRKWEWKGPALFAALVLPWHVYETVVFGTAFWQVYVGWNVFGRYGTNVFGNPALQTNYIQHLFDFAPLVTGALLWALVALCIAVLHLQEHERRLLRATLATVVCMVLVFFTSQTRAFSYLVPLYPLAATVAALAAVGYVRAMK